MKAEGFGFACLTCEEISE